MGAVAAEAVIQKSATEVHTVKTWRWTELKNVLETAQK